MAKKRRKARKKSSNPKKRRTSAKRTHKRNPSRAKRTRARRAHRSSARMHARRHHARRAHKRNPARRHRRKHKRNPGMFSDVLFAMLAGLGGYAATQAIAYFVTKDQAADGQRNRGIVGGVLAAGSMFLSKSHPAMAAGLAAGSIIGAFGGWLTVKLYSVLPAKTMAAVYGDNLAAVYGDNLAAVYGDNLAGIGAFQQINGIGGYDQVLSGYEQINGMGTLMPSAPWQTKTPYG